MRRLPILGLALLLGACGGWPSAGGGGMAEHAAPPTALDTRTTQRLDCSLRRLAAVSEAAKRAQRDTGQLALLRLGAHRAQREAAGRLPMDAERTLDGLDPAVIALARDLGVSSPNPETCPA